MSKERILIFAYLLAAMKHFFLITGPMAVGKMTVAQALCAKTGFKMMHNHVSLELARTMFDWGDPEFKKISEGIRQLVLSTTAAGKTLDGFVFTLVIGYDLPQDWVYVRKIMKLYGDHDWKTHIVELVAPQSIRLERNKTENRLAHKATKRDLDYSHKNILKMEAEERLISKPGELDEFSYLRIDNSDLTPDEAADRIIDHFEL